MKYFLVDITISKLLNLLPPTIIMFDQFTKYFNNQRSTPLSVGQTTQHLGQKSANQSTSSLSVGQTTQHSGQKSANQSTSSSNRTDTTPSQKEMSILEYYQELDRMRRLDMLGC